MDQFRPPVSACWNMPFPLPLRPGPHLGEFCHDVGHLALRQAQAAQKRDSGGQRLHRGPKELWVGHQYLRREGGGRSKGRGGSEKEGEYQDQVGSPPPPGPSHLGQVGSSNAGFYQEGEAFRQQIFEAIFE